MDSKIWKISLLMLLLVYFETNVAAESIQIERYEKWNHPVISVFKKYNMSLYKVSYSKDGTCPTFYANFKYDPLSGANDDYYSKAYREISDANSSFPYAIVDQRDNLKINVGYEDKAKTIRMVRYAEVSSPSTCKDGNSSPDAEQFIITKQMKERIMNSPFKVFLRKVDGKRFIAYLYAEDEKIVPFEYGACDTGKKVELNAKKGHYFIYLYDESSGSFLPNRIRVFNYRDPATMNIEGADFFVLSGANQNKSDVLFVSQRNNCRKNYYEVYGFWEEQSSLQEYNFVKDENNKYMRASGLIDKNKLQDGKLIMEMVNGQKSSQFALTFSEKPREILLKQF